MNTKNIAFPYPVLGHEDDVHSTFFAHLEQKEEKNGKYSFSLKFTTDNKTITELVADGKVKYACDVDCNKTFLRFCEQSDTPEVELELRATEIAEKVTILPCMLACEEFDYVNPDFNPDYGTQTFRMMPGDIIAIAPEIRVYFSLTDTKNDRGEDIVVFERCEEKKYVEYDLDREIIAIMMPADIYDNYLRIKNGHPEVIYSTVVMPAFTLAFQNLHNPEFDGKRWNDELKQRVNTHPDFKDFRDYDSTESKDASEANVMAQILLDNSCSKLYKTLNANPITDDIYEE